MSQRPFGYGNRQGRWDSYSYERAGPRMSSQGQKQYRHPVIPVSTTSVPHYAQASQLYPMHTPSERDSIYRYRPGSGAFVSSGRPTSPTGGSTSPASMTTGTRSDSPTVIPGGGGVGSQAVVIPVLHLGSSSSSNRSVTSPTHSSGSRDTSEAGTNGQQGDQVEVTSRSPAFRTSSSVITAGGTVSGGRSPATSQRKLLPSDQEAEVDALTSILIQSMETKSSSGAGNVPTSTNSVSPMLMADSTTGSPAGSLRRGSGGQLGRLQQHIGLTSTSPTPSSQLLSGVGSSTNSTLNDAFGSSPVWSNHQHHGSGANSPTGSTTSLPNTTTEHGGNSVTNSSLLNQNSCFRCRRALIPTEGSTLSGGGVNGANANAHLANVVTLTGALAARLHVACFTCYRCAAPLRPDAYYHNIRRLLCPACVRDGAVETCSNCHRPIADRIIHAMGMPYHPNCFVCVVCSNRLDSRPFTIDVHGRLHCLSDFHRRYAPRCAVCSKPIAPDPGSQEARRVVFGDSSYHIKCYGVQTVTQYTGGVTNKTSKLGATVVS